MNFFKTDYFTFNGKKSEDYQVIMCSVDEDTNEFTFGSPRTIQQGNSTSDLKSLDSITNEYVDIPFTITRYKEWNLLPITYEDLFELRRWLCKKDYCSLEFNGFSVNMLMKSMTLVQYNKDEEGYIKCVASFEPYMTNKIRKQYRVKDSVQFDIYNKTNMDDSFIDQIDIDLNKGDYIKIKNLTNNKEFSIEGVDSNFIRILSSDYRFVYNPKNPNNNVYKYLVKKEWDTFKLNYGKNSFLIESNQAKIELLWKERIALM